MSRIASIKFSVLKLIRHEYWPMVWFYAPLLPLYFVFSIRRKSFAWFSNLNRAIPYGGIFGEEKWPILQLFPSELVPKTLLLKEGANLNPDKWIIENGLKYPLIAKPNIGERGRGVRVIYSEGELQQLMGNLPEDYLLQEKIEYAEEFGVLFTKNPLNGLVNVLSVTGKKFLSVTGNGKENIETLLGNSLRGWIQLSRLRIEEPELLKMVPESGILVKVGNIGNHCLGTTFFSRNDLLGEEINKSFTNLLKDLKDIEYARLDLRCQSGEDLMKGQKLSIMEMNGLTSEPGLVFDPSWPVWRSWSEVARHLKELQTVSLRKEEMGHLPHSEAEIWHLIGSYFGLTDRFWFKHILSFFQKRKHLPAAIINPSSLQSSAIGRG